MMGQLKREVGELQSKLDQYQEQVGALEEEMEQKCNKYSEEVELGK